MITIRSLCCDDNKNEKWYNDNNNKNDYTDDIYKNNNNNNNKINIKSVQWNIKQKIKIGKKKWHSKYY